MHLMGGRQKPRAESMSRGPALIGGQVGVAAARRRAATDAALDGHAEEPDARPDDHGNVGDRCLFDAILDQLAATLGAGRLGDGNVDGGLGELLGGRCLAAPEKPLTRLASRLLGLRDPRPLGKRRCLTRATAFEGLDLRLEFEYQGDEDFAIQFVEIHLTHDGQYKNRRRIGQEGR